MEDFLVLEDWRIAGFACRVLACICCCSCAEGKKEREKKKIKRNNEIVKQGGGSIKKIKYILARFLLPAACSWSDIVG
jgi:hypothetical protein